MNRRNKIVTFPNEHICHIADGVQFARRHKESIRHIQPVSIGNMSFKWTLLVLATKEHPGFAVPVFIAVYVRTHMAMAVIVRSKSVN
jgi:hypothetical protein